MVCKDLFVVARSFAIHLSEEALNLCVILHSKTQMSVVKLVPILGALALSAFCSSEMVNHPMSSALCMFSKATNAKHKHLF